MKKLLVWSVRVRSFPDNGSLLVSAGVKKDGRVPALGMSRLTGLFLASFYPAFPDIDCPVRKEVELGFPSPF